jgi:hypothetical protein
MIQRALGWAFLALCGVILLAAEAAGQTAGPNQKPLPRPLDAQQILSWLPPDTETVIVARDFTLPDPAVLEKTKSYTQELAFSGLALRTWEGAYKPLASYFKNQKVSLAMEGSRKFRPHGGLGLMPFEGCTLIIFDEQLSDRADQYFKAASATALRIEEVEGHKFLVFQNRLYSDTALWTAFVGFAGPKLLLVATDMDYLRGVLSRTAGKNGVRALPDTLAEWGYVDTGAQFWGLRHFDRSGRDQDPSSPFWDPSKVVKSPWTDEQAVGLTFSYDPPNAKHPTITYLSGNPSAGKETLSLRHEGSKFGVSVRELDARAIVASYNLEHPEGNMFTFYLGAFLGHMIFL